MIATLKTLTLLGALGALLVGATFLVAPSLWPIALALAVAMNVGAWWWSDRALLRMSGAREVSPAEAPGLHAMTRDLAERAGVPMPRLAIVDDPVPNAFATGPTPERGVVAVTTGLLSILDARELRGVLAHELAHVANRDTLVATIAATLSAAVSALANLVALSGLLGMFGSTDGEDEEPAGAGGGLLVTLVAPLAATLVQLGVSRSREYHADATAARWTGDPDALASALERLEATATAAMQVGAPEPTPAVAALGIVNPLQALGALFSTHPRTADRVARLRAMRGVAPRRQLVHSGTSWPRPEGWR